MATYAAQSAELGSRFLFVFAAGRRPVDAAAAFVSFFLAMPFQNIRALGTGLCSCLVSTDEPTCAATTWLTRPELRSFPCSGGQMEQYIWWFSHLGSAAPVIHLDWGDWVGNCVEVGAMTVLIAVALSSIASYAKYRSYIMTVWRLVTFSVAAASVVVNKYVWVGALPLCTAHFGRNTLWGTSNLIWHGLINAVPFKTHLKLAPFEFLATALCVLLPRLGTPQLTLAFALEVLLKQSLAGVLLPSALLFYMEILKRCSIAHPPPTHASAKLTPTPTTPSPPDHTASTSAELTLTPSTPSPPDSTSTTLTPTPTPTPPSGAASSPSWQPTLSHPTPPGSPPDPKTTTDRQPASNLHAPIPHGLLDTAAVTPQPSNPHAQSPTPLTPAAAAFASSPQPQVAPMFLAAHAMCPPGLVFSARKPYQSASMNCVVSIKVPHPPPDLEADPAPLLDSLQGVLAQTPHDTAVVIHDHVVVKGCIQLVVWLRAGLGVESGGQGGAALEAARKVLGAESGGQGGAALEAARKVLGADAELHVQAGLMPGVRSGRLRVVLAEASPGRVLVDEEVEVECGRVVGRGAVEGAGSCVEADMELCFRLSIPRGPVPNNPRPHPEAADLLVMPIGDNRGTLLWSTPLLLGAPADVIAELAQLHSAMSIAKYQAHDSADGGAELAHVQSSVAPGADAARWQAVLGATYQQHLVPLVWDLLSSFQLARTVQQQQQQAGQLQQDVAQEQDRSSFEAVGATGGRPSQDVAAEGARQPHKVAACAQEAAQKLLEEAVSNLFGYLHDASPHLSSTLRWALAAHPPGAPVTAVTAAGMPTNPLAAEQGPPQPNPQLAPLAAPAGHLPDQHFALRAPAAHAATPADGGAHQQPGRSAGAPRRAPPAKRSSMRHLRAAAMTAVVRGAFPSPTQERNYQMHLKRCTDWLDYSIGLIQLLILVAMLVKFAQWPPAALPIVAQIVAHVVLHVRLPGRARQTYERQWAVTWVMVLGPLHCLPYVLGWSKASVAYMVVTQSQAFVALGVVVLGLCHFVADQGGFLRTASLLLLHCFQMVYLSWPHYSNWRVLATHMTTLIASVALLSFAADYYHRRSFLQAAYAEEG